MRKPATALILFAASTLHSAQDTIEIPEYGLSIPFEVPAEQPPEMECFRKQNIITNGEQWKGYRICTKVKYL